MADMHSSARIIAPSRRPDGTVRKEVRVRPGFKSEELDASTGAYKSKGTLLREQQVIPPSAEELARQKLAQARAERRKRAKEKKKTGWDEDDKEEDGDVKDATAQLANTSITPATTTSTSTSTSKPTSTSTSVTSTSTSVPEEDTDTDPAKLIKKLTKKLREIEKLQSDQSSGRTLTTAELEKIARLPIIQKQIESANAKLATS